MKALWGLALEPNLTSVMGDPGAELDLARSVLGSDGLGAVHAVVGEL